MWGYSSDLKVSVLLRSARYIMYLVYSCILLNDNLIDIKLGIKLYRFIAVFASIYLLLQYVLLYVFNYSLPGYISWLPLMRSELEEFTENLGATFYARPRSIFAEPSQFGIFATGYLMLSVLYQRREKDWGEKAVILLAMALSASSTSLLGVGMVAVIYGVRLYKKYEKNKKKLLRWAAVAVGSVVLLLLVSNFVRDRVLYLLLRLPNSFNNRLGGFLEYGQRVKDFSFLQVLFGIGMDLRNMTVWYSGLIKILLYFGVVGTAYFCTFVINAVRRSKPAQRLYLLIFLLLCVFSEILASNWLILFLPFVLRNLDRYPEGELRTVQIDNKLWKWVKNTTERK